MRRLHRSSIARRRSQPGPKRTLVTLILACVIATIAAVAGAQEEEKAPVPFVVDGLHFDGWQDLLGSEYFRAAGLRCGTPTRQARELTYGPATKDASDCSANRTHPTAAYDPDALYEIPVVVHVIMDSSCSQGAIPDSLVRSQIEILNADLQALLGTDGANGTDARIRFALATVDPSGAATTGITRSCNTTWFNDGGSYWNSLAWDPHHYLNIYTNEAGGNLGYVPFLPADSSGTLVGSAEDRVVVLWSSFGRNAPIGSPYDRGRTTTHEVGHYLGLEHTFNPESTCGSASAPGCYSDGDLICDTPVEQSAASSQCALGESTSCGSVDPTDNYMDYSDDLCMQRFTREQIRRIRCSMESYRPSLFRIVGSSAPQVTISSPSNGSSFPLGSNVPFAGSASDAEDGDLSANLSWTSSHDGDLGSGSSLSTVLSAGVHTITAAVSDSSGQQGSAAITVTISAGNTAPVVSITAPGNGTSFAAGTPVELQGSASDAQDGDLTANLSWTSSLDGSLGTGGSLSVSLSAGTHTIAATVVDSGGLQGSSSTNITVTTSGCSGGGLVESFEAGAAGWTTSGLWHLASNSSCASPAYSSALRAMYYGRDESCDYDTGSATRGDLISPEITGIGPSSTLTFDFLRQVESEPGDRYDTTEVAISRVGSSTWTTVWSRDSRDPSQNGWSSSVAISLAAYAGASIRARFRFDSIDDFNNDFTGWLIDDVEVTAACAGSGGTIFADGLEAGDLSRWSSFEPRQ